MQDFPHVVMPGQLIAVSSSSTTGEDSFLQGHGTYIEHIQPNHQRSSDGAAVETTPHTDDGQSSTTIQLRAAVCGTVQRVNKLISVETVALHSYHAQVGDLIVGRVTGISNARWILDVSGRCANDGHNNPYLSGTLPLSGVHLPGSVQRVRTAADALEMRQFIREGDLVSCEVHKINHHNVSSSMMLHTRSVRYGKLENGVVIVVPPKLVPRRKTHYTSIIDHRFQILLGCNGMIWIQRNNHQNNDVLLANSRLTASTMGSPIGQQELAEAEEERRKVHAETRYSFDDRKQLARLRNSIQCLRCTLSPITPERVSEVYYRSLSPEAIIPIADMLLPENMVQLTTSLSTR
jgi:exosome complex component RRP4